MATGRDAGRGRQAHSERPVGYLRERDLARLLRLWPEEAARLVRDDHRAVLAALRRALRAERRRGIAGHWTYDLARHWALVRALESELAAASRRPTAPARSRTEAPLPGE